MLLKRLFANIITAIKPTIVSNKLFDIVQATINITIERIRFMQSKPNIYFQNIILPYPYIFNVAILQAHTFLS